MVICCGEVLVDWVATAPSPTLAAARAFEKRPGGAPANVAVHLARRGVDVAFMGGVSPDPFGAWLLEVLAAEGVDVGAAVILDRTQTRMAYVIHDETGDRRLAAFSDLACADAAFGPAHLDLDRLRRCRIFHYGGMTLTTAEGVAAAHEAVRVAREAGALVSFDPNWREPLWRGRADAQRLLADAMGDADVVKATREEHLLLAPDLRPRLMLAITDGLAGARWITPEGQGTCPSPAVEVVDTTGAGDAFTAGLLAGLLAHGDAARAVAEGCRAGAEACTHVGAF